MRSSSGTAARGDRVPESQARNARRNSWSSLSKISRICCMSCLVDMTVASIHGFSLARENTPF